MYLHTYVVVTDTKKHLEVRLEVGNKEYLSIIRQEDLVHIKITSQDLLPNKTEEKQEVDIVLVKAQVDLDQLVSNHEEIDCTYLHIKNEDH